MISSERLVSYPNESPTAAPGGLLGALPHKGFRPFFLLAAVFGALLVPLWLLVLSGIVRPALPLDATTWHAHEMVLGFSVAVVAGFLLTAVGNWTQRETATGAPLVALAALWIAGRVLLLVGGRLPYALVAAVDLAFLPALIVTLARPLVAAKNRRNFVMLAALAALVAVNVVVHLDTLGLVAAGAGRRACVVGVDVVVLLVAIIAGRVFPMFTRNATRDVADPKSIRSLPVLDGVAIAGIALLTLVDAVDPNGLLAASVAVVAGLAAAGRTAHWGARHSFREPLLWILHVGYAWIPIGLVLRGAAYVDPTIPASLATHALTAGAIGSLTLGMMARVALGHTGRTLAAPRAMTWAFVAITAAAVARALAPLVVPSRAYASLWVAGAFWTAAFATYAVAYARILWSPRVDGKMG